MTVAELIDLLARFDSEVEVEFMSPDGPDYAELVLGTRRTSTGYVDAIATIGNDGLDAR